MHAGSTRLRGEARALLEAFTSAPLFMRRLTAARLARQIANISGVSTCNRQLEKRRRGAEK
eukprot:scaffold107306_cov30-Tisochrysis_lutea.AAC.5